MGGGGGWVISDLKSFIAIFCIQNCNFSLEFPENFEKGGGHFRSEKFHCKFGAVWSGLQKKLLYIFRKRGGGGVVKGRSKNFRKFIRFPERRLPLFKCVKTFFSVDASLMIYDGQLAFRPHKDYSNV